MTARCVARALEPTRARDACETDASLTRVALCACVVCARARARSALVTDVDCMKDEAGGC